MSDSGAEVPSSSSPSLRRRLFTRYQKFLDDLVPFKTFRWLFALFIVVCYTVRVVLLQGWYIVSYALAIYLLNLFVAFISPKIDPAFEDDEETEDGPQLPTTSNEEFKPFIRRLPEFKFWLRTVYAVVVAFTCTFFVFCNVPVYWPILALYFIVLFSYTMKRQIMHMIRYRYLPFTHGKRRYKGKDATVLQ